MFGKNILLIQNDLMDARAVHDALDGSFQVDWVRSCAEGLERLARDGKQEQKAADTIEAILVDLFLPDSGGIETFHQLFHVAPQLPILVLSTTANEAIAHLAVQHGAQDYLLKDRLDDYSLPKALGSMVERAAIAEALFAEKERAQGTLNSIGNAVISTDVEGRVTYLNIVAEGLTGWSREEADGHAVDEVLRIIDATTRKPVTNLTVAVIRENKTVSLTPNGVLVRRDGVEAAIEDSAAPIHDSRGQVTGAVIVFRDVSTTRALSLRMAYLALHDGLTNLPNRILLSDRLKEALGMARRYQRKLAVLFVDVDRFKHVNDSLGHEAGDRLLQSVAGRLHTCVRSSDTIGRRGGDEFVVLLPEISHSQDAAASAEKILLAVSEPHSIDLHDVHVTASIGVATYPDDGDDAETLLKHADFAMYHAKENGRNNWQFFKPEMTALAVERQILENGLRHALDHQQLMLHYQPMMNLTSGVVMGVEALIRWRHPQLGLVSPAQFIPIAEECGFIVPIGRWVLREACRQARIWHEKGLTLTRLAVNVSAVELRDRDFIVGVRTILSETALDPHHLELELTETVLLQDFRSAAAVLNSLKNMGVCLALDDFGTGYSSLTHLRRLPIDTLKIDQFLVRDLARDDDVTNFVSAVIGMGKSLHLRVVAEGIETRAQLAFLQEQRCPIGQGCYFSEPLAAAECAELLHPGYLNDFETPGVRRSPSRVTAVSNPG